MLTSLRAFFLCRKGHARGKPIEPHLIVEHATGPTVKTYQCPRCGSKWERKVYRKGA